MVSFLVLSTLPVIFLIVLLNPATSIPTFLPPHNPPPDGPSRILLLTAHPDDECLFFAPTVLALLRQGSSTVKKNEVFSLCLSTGDADGLGEVRAQELERSLDILGVEKDKRWVVDRPDLRDNLTEQWDPEIIAKVIQPYIIQHRLTTILTFDHGGISQHPNHISLPRGVANHLASYNPHFAFHLQPRPRLYTLITHSLLPKYTGPLAPVLAKSDLQVHRTLNGFFLWVSRIAGVDVERSGTDIDERAERDVDIYVFVSGVREYWTAVQAMRAHGSQLVWFRWLYVVFSRYMWVNEWVEVIQ